MPDNYLARFSDNPCLVEASQVRQFESLLRSLNAEMAGPRGDEIMRAAANTNDDDYWGEPGSYLSYLRPYNVQDGILLIPVRGVLLNGFPYQYGSYATGYEYIWKAFARGLKDGNVRAIALVINSPGGDVAGNFDLVDKMFSARGTKPVRAFAAEHAYSAAYSIASAADEIVVARTGGVGSIGVLTMHVDMSKMYEDYGIKVTYIFAGKHKIDGNSLEALPDDVKKRWQARVDELYGIFTSTVARNRKIEDKAVRDTEALTFMASEAVSVGLADRIGSLEDSLAAFAAELDEDGNMDPKEKAAFDQGKAEGHAAGLADGKAAGLTDGAKAERTRITTILGCAAAQKRPKAAMSAALKSGMDAETAESFLADLPEEQAPSASTAGSREEQGQQRRDSAFNNAMNRDKHPEAGEAGGDEQGHGGGQKPDRAAVAMDRVFGERKRA